MLREQCEVTLQQLPHVLASYSSKNYERSCNQTAHRHEVLIPNSDSLKFLSFLTSCVFASLLHCVFASSTFTNTLGQYNRKQPGRFKVRTAVTNLLGYWRSTRCGLNGSKPMPDRSTAVASRITIVSPAKYTVVEATLVGLPVRANCGP